MHFSRTDANYMNFWSLVSDSFDIMEAPEGGREAARYHIVSKAAKSRVEYQICRCNLDKKGMKTPFFREKTSI